jgi:hypothetical protein
MCELLVCSISILIKLYENIFFNNDFSLGSAKHLHKQRVHKHTHTHTHIVEVKK